VSAGHPIAAVCEAARKLAACNHDDVGMLDWKHKSCLACGAVYSSDGGGTWKRPRLVEVLVDASREAEVFAANLARIRQGLELVDDEGEDKGENDAGG